MYKTTTLATALALALAVHAQAHAQNSPGHATAATAVGAGQQAVPASTGSISGVVTDASLEISYEKALIGAGFTVRKAAGKDEG